MCWGEICNRKKKWRLLWDRIRRKTDNLEISAFKNMNNVSTTRRNGTKHVCVCVWVAVFVQNTRKVWQNPRIIFILLDAIVFTRSAFLFHHIDSNASVFPLKPSHISYKQSEKERKRETIQFYIQSEPFFQLITCFNL